LISVGPEVNDGRASTGYLLWRDGKARIMSVVIGGYINGSKTQDGGYGQSA